jgi:glutaredoxin-like protein DUF836
MKQFILYGTLGCHLCELAEAQLAPLLALLQQQALVIEIECVDIADADALLQRYGELIPVLRRLRDDAELGWPFEEQTLHDFLRDELLV